MTTRKFLIAKKTNIWWNTSKHIITMRRTTRKGPSWINKLSTMFQISVLYLDKTKLQQPSPLFGSSEFCCRDVTTVTYMKEKKTIQTQRYEYYNSKSNKINLHVKSLDKVNSSVFLQEMLSCFGSCFNSFNKRFICKSVCF